MKRLFLRSAAIAMLFGVTGKIAAEITRTPISLERGYMHCPIVDKDEGAGWMFNIWAGGYLKQADRAFIKSGTKKSSLGTLWFGEPSFTISQIFANEDVSAAENPILSLQKFEPKFDYNEEGVIAGLNFDVQFGSEDKWHMGYRTNLPFKRIKVERKSDFDADKSAQDVLDDFIIKKTEQLPIWQKVDDAWTKEGQREETLNSYAYNLNLLSQLYSSPGNKLVKFADVTTSDHITIAGKDLTGNIAAAGNIVNIRPGVAALPGTVSSLDSVDVQLIDSNLINVTDTISTDVAPIGDANTSIKVAVPTDGSIESRAMFVADNNYTNLGNDSSALENLWIVPQTYWEVVNEGSPEDPLLVAYPRETADSVSIRNTVENLVGQLSSSASDFLKSKNVSWDDQVATGLGDWLHELYISYDFTNWWTSELIGGIKIPTGEIKKKEDVLKLLMPILGNNGHVELHLAIENRFAPLAWLRFKGFNQLSWALEATENRAAAFANTCNFCGTQPSSCTLPNINCFRVKNIGPSVEARNHWWTYTGRWDLTVVHPYNHKVGFDLGYEFYYKGHDRIRYKDSCVCDWLNNVNTLDHKVLECGTKEYSHKIRAELFGIGDYYQIFAGMTQVLGGKNAPAETDFHVGANIVF
ncbi:MAG: hypothetical protein UR26_C0007G0022 [candidate division TM6 bacterium GW2011_GWF2_32_72]|nr:MAG: hypothetical protein UR26_C0007G0022 [candidate division TM6 bacterium GW2011_GWF2_32_72]